MTWDPYAAWHAAQEAGMLAMLSIVTIGDQVYSDVFVKWFQPDQLCIEGNSQHTDYHIEFRTIDLPGLSNGDAIVCNGITYTVKGMPAFAENKPGGHFSRVDLTAAARTFPKEPIALPNQGAEMPVQTAGANEYLSRIAAQALGGHRVVRSIGATSVDYADNTIEAHGDVLLGITVTSASAGASILVQNEGELEFSGWSWVPNQPIYLDVNGLITQTPPESPSKFSATLGFAMTSSKIFIEITDIIFLE
jgi:hypothetical protein